MDIFLIIVATIAGTTFMTAFSYILSDAFRKLFKEPVLINYVIRKSKIDFSPRSTNIVGWVIHYLIGLAFVVSYDLIWRNTIMEFSWLSGFILGCISGIIGILGWMVLFRLPSEEPRVYYTAYYIQLFYAHIIFAMGATAVYAIWGGV